MSNCYFDKGHLRESFVLKRRESPDIPTLAFVDESVGKEFSNSGGKLNEHCTSCAIVKVKVCGRKSRTLLRRKFCAFCTIRQSESVEGSFEL